MVKLLMYGLVRADDPIDDRPSTGAHIGDPWYFGSISKTMLQPVLPKHVLPDTHPTVNSDARRCGGGGE